MVSLLDRIRTKRALLSKNGAELEHSSVKGREVGNTFILYIMLFPVVFAAFGLAIDTTLATYTQTSLQSSLDAALQSSLSRAVNPGSAGTGTATQPILTKDQARTYIINVYDTNRMQDGEQPFIQCYTSATVESFSSKSTPPDVSHIPVYDGYKKIDPPSGCSWLQRSYEFRNAGGGVITVAMGIQEKSSPIFLRFVGIDKFIYDIDSDARITYARG